jgi:hypothetical protein
VEYRWAAIPHTKVRSDTTVRGRSAGLTCRGNQPQHLQLAGGQLLHQARQRDSGQAGLLDAKGSRAGHLISRQ